MWLSPPFLRTFISATVRAVAYIYIYIYIIEEYIVNCLSICKQTRICRCFHIFFSGGWIDTTCCIPPIFIAVAMHCTVRVPNMFQSGRLVRAAQLGFCSTGFFDSRTYPTVLDVAGHQVRDVGTGRVAPTQSGSKFQVLDSLKQSGRHLASTPRSS